MEDMEDLSTKMTTDLGKAQHPMTRYISLSMILIVVMCKSPSAPDIDTADSPLTFSVALVRKIPSCWNPAL